MFMFPFMFVIRRLPINFEMPFVLSDWLDWFPHMAGEFYSPISPAILLIWMILPHFLAFIPGITACVRLIKPNTLVSKIFLISASGTISGTPEWPKPALLTEKKKLRKTIMMLIFTIELNFEHNYNNYIMIGYSVHIHFAYTSCIQRPI